MTCPCFAAAEMVKEEDFIEPLEASAADLRVTHTDRYLTSLGVRTCACHVYRRGFWYTQHSPWWL